MSAKYLVRFDDACPTMDWSLWNGIEDVLDEANVKPIIAVVPDNQDPSLHHGRHDEKFWDRVRGWQSRGWTIGLHGYQHRFVTRDAGIMGLNPYSEFAGLPAAEQEAKLRAACRILWREDVRPDVWVAPAHSFDLNTVAALRKLSIPAISDGLSVLPYRQHGLLWIPQQIWRFHAMGYGVWTVCIHMADSPHNDLASFRRSVQQFRPAITTVAEVARCYGQRTRTLVDAASEAVLRARMRAGRLRSAFRSVPPPQQPEITTAFPKAD